MSKLWRVPNWVQKLYIFIEFCRPWILRIFDTCFIDITWSLPENRWNPKRFYFFENYWIFPTLPCTILRCMVKCCTLMWHPYFFWTGNLICSSEIWLWKQAWHHCKGKTSNFLDRKWKIQENLEKSHGQVSCKRCSCSSLNTLLSNQFSACNQNELQLRSYKVRIEFEL